MCRTGGRRCKGSHASSRATQTVRKQRSRAQQSLRKAKAAGDADAVAKAEQRLTQINAASNVTKENALPRNDKPTSAGDARGQSGDVTEPNAMEMLRQMRDEMREREQAARDAAAKARPQQPDPVSDKVVKRLEGTCPNGHLVFVNTSVPGYLANSPAFASTDCPSCGGFVRLLG